MIHLYFMEQSIITYIFKLIGKLKVGIQIIMNLNGTKYINK